MSHWWRAYDEAVDDPKLQRLGPVLGWAWFNLMCLASKNGGILPAIGDVAFKLRVGERKAAEIITALTLAGLFEKRSDGKFEPHNWRSRQYKSDVSTDRVKRFRNRQRNVSETPPDTETDTEDGGGEDARAREPLLSPEAISLANELAGIAGHDPEFVPPSWCGAAMTVQKWRNEGWPAEVIRATVKEVAAKKRDGPASTITYFERPIATAVARLKAPLPVVQIAEQSPEVIHVKPAGGNVIPAARDLAERLAEFNRPAPSELRGGSGADAIRAIPKR